MDAARLDPPPDAFAVVMATGIVSVAAYDQAYRWIGLALGILAVVVFGLLSLAVLVRAGTRGRRRHHPEPATGTDLGATLRRFTFVAACAVLGVRWNENPPFGWLLAGLAVAAWLLLLARSVRDLRASDVAGMRDQARGAWLLPAVATAGLAIRAADLAVKARLPALVVVGVGAWVLAILIYLAVAGLIASRAIVGPFGPDAVAPDSWILMGALAITTLAGDHILAAVRTLGDPSGVAVWSRSVTLSAWALASLWVPPLLVAVLWRARRVAGSLSYHRTWWSAVFPIGMYAAASCASADELELPALGTVSLVFFWAAFAAWAAVAFGLLRSALAARARR